MKKGLIALVTCVVVAVAICVTLALRGRAKGSDGTESAPSAVRGEEKSLRKGAVRKGRKFTRQPRSKVNKDSAERRPEKPEKPVLSFSDGDDDDDDFTPAERALSKRIEAALDEEDLAKAVACVKEAQSCPNAEIRQAMVDTLGWFGEKGLPELTPFLADSDEDVRDSALNEWTMALAEIEDEPEKLGIVELAMNVLSDEDSLENIADEYIGADEKLAVESLLRVIEGGGSKEGIAKAKETYEFVTGDEFTDRAAAEKWIAEEYMPDEPPPQEQVK